MNRTNELAHGVLGMGTSAAAIVVSRASQVEQWLRITSLVIGIAVGLLTFALLLRRWLRGDNRTDA